MPLTVCLQSVAATRLKRAGGANSLRVNRVALAASAGHFRFAPNSGHDAMCQKRHRSSNLRKRPPAEAASRKGTLSLCTASFKSQFAKPSGTEQRRLRRCAFHCENAERRILVADGLRVLATRGIPPCLRLIHALELKHNYPRRRWRTLKRCGLSASHDVFSAPLFDCFRSGRNEFFRVAVFVRHGYFNDDVASRLCLCVKALDRQDTERKTRGHCQSNSVFGFHATYSSRWQIVAGLRTVISTATEQTRNYRSRMMPADGTSAAVKIRKKGQSARPTSSSLKRLYPFPVSRQCDACSCLRTVCCLESRWQSFPCDTVRCSRGPIRAKNRSIGGCNSLLCGQKRTVEVSFFSLCLAQSPDNVQLSKVRTSLDYRCTSGSARRTASFTTARLSLCSGERCITASCK